MSRKHKLITIDAYDIGGKIKYAAFLANQHGQFWPVGGADFKTKKTITPHHIPANEFFQAFSDTLSAAKQWRDNVDVRAVDICGPVVNNVCLRLVNRGILDSFGVSSDVVLNDAMAAFLGSLVAGVAKGHNGGAAFITLGTGVGGAMRVWASDDDWVERLKFYDVEMHFSIAVPEGGFRKCGCNLRGCAEAEVNESALKDLLLQQGLDLEELKKPGKPSSDIGRDLEYHLNRGLTSEFVSQIETALAFWRGRLALVVSNLLGGHVLGGDKIRPKAKIIFGGGLARFVEAADMEHLVLELSSGCPQNGANFEICCETELENRAGVIGAAAAGLMKRLKCGIGDLEYLPDGPSKKKAKKK